MLFEGCQVWISPSTNIADIWLVWWNHIIWFILWVIVTMWMITVRSMNMSMTVIMTVIGSGTSTHHLLEWWKWLKKLNKILGKNFFSLNLILNEWSAVKGECARPRGCYITRCYTRDWAFKAIAQSQNVINKNVIFTWNGWVNCGIDCWFCCRSLFWLNILSKLISFLFVCFVLFCSVLSSFFIMFGSRYCSLILFSEKCVPAKFVFSFWVPRILSSMNTKWRSVHSITASDDAAPTERE